MRVDCGYPCIGELDTTTVMRALPLDTKKTIKIPLACFAAKGTDFEAIDVPFLVYTDRPFVAAFANIRWQVNAANDPDALACADLEPPPPPAIDPLPGPSVTLFGSDGSFLPGYSMGIWANNTNNAHVVLDTTTTPGVIDLQFLADGADGVTFVSGGSPLNLSNYANGKLRFELAVSSWGSNTQGLAIKMESPGDSCRNIDYVVPDKPPADGQFRTVTLDVAAVAGQRFKDCFMLENISVPFGIFPVWGDQQGVRFQVKNVQLLQ